MRSLNSRLAKLEAKVPEAINSQQWAPVQPHVTEEEMMFLSTLPSELAQWSDTELRAAEDIVGRMVPLEDHQVRYSGTQ